MVETGKKIIFPLKKHIAHRVEGGVTINLWQEVPYQVIHQAESRTLVTILQVYKSYYTNKRPPYCNIWYEIS